MESRKQAARRPSPPLPSPASGSCSKSCRQIDPFLPHGLLGNVLEQQVGHIISERAADQELHREVVNAFRILVFVCLFGFHPTLGQDVADRARERFKSRTRVRIGWSEDVIEDEVTFVESALSTRELNRPAAILGSNGFKSLRRYRSCGCIFWDIQMLFLFDRVPAHRTFPFLPCSVWLLSENQFPRTFSRGLIHAKSIDQSPACRCRARKRNQCIRSGYYEISWPILHATWCMSCSRRQVLVDRPQTQSGGTYGSICLHLRSSPCLPNGKK